jgi:hypothetical protein
MGGNYGRESPNASEAVPKDTNSILQDDIKPVADNYSTSHRSKNHEDFYIVEK